MEQRYLTVLLGSSVDLFYRIDSYPAEGDYTYGSEDGKRAGGPPFNAGCVASSLGVPVKALDYLNPEDEDYRILLDTPKEYGVDTSPIRFGTDCTLGKVLIFNRNEKRTMLVINQARPFYPPDEQIRELLNGSRYIYTMIHMMQRFFGDDSPIREARRNGAKMIFDGSDKYADPGRAMMLLELADGLFINSTDYVHLSDCLGEDAKGALLRAGCEFICVTDGENGASCYTKDLALFHPAYRLEQVVDSTGAGDSFAGTFMACRIMGKSYEESLKLASAAGAWCCLHEGGQGGCASLDDLERFIGA